MTIKSVSRLTSAQMFALLALMKAEYADSGLACSEYCSVATEKLGFQVKETHVRGGCRALGLKTNTQVRLDRLAAEEADRKAAKAAQVAKAAEEAAAKAAKKAAQKGSGPTIPLFGEEADARLLAIEQAMASHAKMLEHLSTCMAAVMKDLGVAPADAPVAQVNAH